MVLGIISGITAAFLQSVSYLCSAHFMARSKSSIRLLVFSQLAMGVMSLLMLPFFLPENFEGKFLKLSLLMLCWALVLCIGQGGFFTSQKFIESSRMSSLMGLKILILVAMDSLIFRRLPGLMQFCGVLLCTLSAFVINWSGAKDKKFTPTSLFFLAITLFFYTFADISETELVRLHQSGNIIRDGISATLMCYAFMGVITLPALIKIKWNVKEQLTALPFGFFWLVSQFALLICFGTLGAIFGNVLQSSRGLISVLLGALVCALGKGYLDAPATPQMWLRRAAGAVLMSGGIICYTFGSM